MKLIKGNREARWIPLSNDQRRQVRRGKQNRQFAYVEFEGTKDERLMALRLGRPVPRHQSWVNMTSMMEHAK